MLASFRRDAKKYSGIIYFVLFMLAVPSSFAWLFIGTKGTMHAPIATINGKKIEFDHFHKSLSELQSQISMIKTYARTYGFSDELFLKNMLGDKSPEQIALDRCINDELINQIGEKTKISLDPDIFKEQLIASMPPAMIDDQGNFSLETYQAHLHRLSLTPAQFEKSKEEEFKRELLVDMLVKSFYTTEKEQQLDQNKDSGSRTIEYLRLSLSNALKVEEKKEISQADLENFYQRIQEKYRTPEKRTLSVWNIAMSDYEKSVSVQEEALIKFYEKNKSSLYRVKPKVKVRTLVLKADTDEKIVKEILAKAKEHPEEFAKLVKEYSIDDKTKSDAGAIDFFSRGTLSDTQFETAAFKLKNPLEVSEPTKTTKGIEIIQLIERIAAQEKEFDQVKDEIRKSMLAKKALNEMKSLMDQVARTAKKGDLAGAKAQIEELLSLGKEEKKVISSEDQKKIGAEGDFAQKALKLKKEQPYGHHLENGKFMFFELKEVEKSKIPPLKEVESLVREEYYKEKAREQLKATRNKLVTQLQEQPESLENLGQKNNHTYKKVSGVNKRALARLFPEFKNSSMILNLYDPEQTLCSETKEGDQLIIKFVTEDNNEENNVKRKNKQRRSRPEKQNKVFANAIIASLRKGAKIDTNEEVLKQFAQKY